MTRKTWLRLCLLTAVILGGVAAGLYFYRQSQEPEKLAGQFATLGYNYIDRKQFDLAYRDFLQSLKIIENRSLKNQVLRVNTYLGLAWCYREKNDWNQAVKFYEMACSDLLEMLNQSKYSEKRNKNLIALYAGYTWMMRGYFETKQYSAAPGWFSSIEKLRLSEGADPELARIYMGMARNAQQLKNYDFADKCCDIGLSVCRRGNDEKYNDVEGKLLWIKADNYYQQGHFSVAMDWGRRALIILQKNKLNNPEAVAMIQQHLQDWEINMKK